MTVFPLNKGKSTTGQGIFRSNTAPIPQLNYYERISRVVLYQGLYKKSQGI
jgi:hypothetical protein